MVRTRRSPTTCRSASTAPRGSSTTRSPKPRLGASAGRGPRTAEPPKRGFGERIVELPRGAVLADRQVVGDRLVLTISLPDGGHRLLVVEPGSGTVLGTIELRPQGRE